MSPCTITSCSCSLDRWLAIGPEYALVARGQAMLEYELLQVLTGHVSSTLLVDEYAESNAALDVNHAEYRAFAFGLRVLHE